MSLANLLCDLTSRGETSTKHGLSTINVWSIDRQISRVQGIRISETASQPPGCLRLVMTTWSLQLTVFLNLSRRGCLQHIAPPLVTCSRGASGTDIVVMLKHLPSLRNALGLPRLTMQAARHLRLPAGSTTQNKIQPCILSPSKMMTWNMQPSSIIRVFSRPSGILSSNRVTLRACRVRRLFILVPYIEHRTQYTYISYIKDIFESLCGFAPTRGLY